MKKVWRDGTSAIVLAPLDLIARLCAMLVSLEPQSPPRFNMIRFHGVFAPNAKLRSEGVPKKPSRKLAEGSAAELGDAEQTQLFGYEPQKTKRHPWAWLLKKVFLVDVTECPECRGRMKWLEVCTERRSVLRVLSASGLAPRAPPQVGWAPLGQPRFSF